MEGRQMGMLLGPKRKSNDPLILKKALPMQCFFYFVD
jgi:hypothetical protein